jgi:hypothetical protein
MKILIKFAIISFYLGLNMVILNADTISKVTFKWKDAQGIVQYTERPPKNSAYEQITVNASEGETVTTVTQEEAEAANQDTTKGALDDVVLANQRNCQIAEQNMEVLVNMARIRVSDDKGENRILTPAEKQARLDETQKQIDIYCKASAATQ